MLYPPLGAWLGPELLGALSAVAATALFASIALRAYGERAWLGVIWFGLASAVAPFGGRTTFALGLAIGLLCIWATQRRRPWLAAPAGVAATLASPVAGLFTALACAAALLASRSPSALLGRTDLPVAPALAGLLGAGAALTVMVLLFPTGGFQPFALSAWIWVPLAVAAVLVLSGAEEAVLRWGAVLYLLIATAALLLQTPLGANSVRLGLTFAGPLLAILLTTRRSALLAVLVVPLLWWQWTATARDVAAASGDPSTERAYYAPLLEQLGERAGAGPIRIEVPPTRNRWEAAYLADRVPLARGWLRQLESDDFELFEGDRLDAAAYRDWLADHGVSYVALAGTEPDYLAEREVELLERGVPGLEQVWSNRDWRLFEVQGGPPAPLVDGDAEVLELAPDRAWLELREPVISVALRGAGWLGVSSGGACGAGPNPDLGEDWIEVRADGASERAPRQVELAIGGGVAC